MLFWHLVLHCNTCILCCCSIFFHICILCNHQLFWSPQLLRVPNLYFGKQYCWGTWLHHNPPAAESGWWAERGKTKLPSSLSYSLHSTWSPLVFHASSFFATMVIYNERSLTIDNQFYSLAVHDPNTFSIFTSPLHFLFWKSHSRPPVIKWIQRLSCK